MAKSWDRATMRFAQATYRGRQGMLDITFENGDHYVVAAELVLERAGVREARSRASETSLAWDKMRIGETGDVLEIPAQGRVIEIPWDRIRVLADPDFRAHLAERAHERARHLGQRLRAMRQDAGLTLEALAEKVGVSQEEIVSLEGGKGEPQTDLLQHIAGVFGRRLRDFIEE